VHAGTVDAALPDIEAKLRGVFGKFACQGTILVVVDRSAWISRCQSR
jgi:hypothetical protein